MPFYEYRCKRGHTFEVLQRMSDDPLTSCNTCDAEVQRVLHPVAVHFKGSGFYTTDYGRGKGGGDSSSTDGRKDGAGKDSAKSEGGSDKGAKSGADAKSDSSAKSKKAASASSE